MFKYCELCMGYRYGMFLLTLPCYISPFGSARSSCLLQLSVHVLMRVYKLEIIYKSSFTVLTVAQTPQDSLKMNGLQRGEPTI